MNTQKTTEHFKNNRLGYIAIIIGSIALVASIFSLHIIVYVDPEPEPDALAEIISDIAADVIIGNDLQLKDSGEGDESIDFTEAPEGETESLLSKFKRKAQGAISTEKEQSDEVSTDLDVQEDEVKKESLISVISSKTKDKIRGRKEGSENIEAVTQEKLPSRFVFPSIISLGVLSVILGIVSLFKNGNKLLGGCAILFGLGAVLVCVTIYMMLLLIVVALVMITVGALTVFT